MKNPFTYLHLKKADKAREERKKSAQKLLSVVDKSVHKATEQALEIIKRESNG